MGKIKKLIIRNIFELSEDGFARIFTGTWKRDGAVIINYASQQSMDWLKSLIGVHALHVRPGIFRSDTG